MSNVKNFKKKNHPYLHVKRIHVMGLTLDNHSIDDNN